MPNDKLNGYGDQLLSTTGEHGADIAIQRLDDLDRQALLCALKLPDRSRVHDIGCGHGSIGSIFAMFGLNTTLVDLQPGEEKIGVIFHLFPAFIEARWIAKDVRRLNSDVFQGSQLVYSQRTIHYFPYSDTRKLLKNISRKAGSGLRLFISASGIDSELGDGYDAREQDITERYGPLRFDMAEKHQIYGSVCLYSEDDMCKLLREGGFKADQIWRSTFGNIKAVATLG